MNTRGQARTTEQPASQPPTENTEQSRAATEISGPTRLVVPETTEFPGATRQVAPEMAEITGAARHVVPGNIQAPSNGVHYAASNNGAVNDLFQHVNRLLVEQQRLASSNFDTNSPSQVSWNDPQIHLSAAAGKSTSSYLDICDFAQTCVEEEVVLGSQGDQQIIVKSGPKKPRLENLTLCQWSVANLAILYKLVGENKLQGSALMDYLSYTTKIYQLVQRYSLVSVLLYDREYRKLQASLNSDGEWMFNIYLTYTCKLGTNQ